MKTTTKNKRNPAANTEASATINPVSDYVLPGMKRHTLGMLFGEDGIGKTKLIIQEMIKISIGEPSALKLAPTPRKVLYLGLEKEKNEIDKLFESSIDFMNLSKSQTQLRKQNLTVRHLGLLQVVEQDYVEDFKCIEDVIPESGVDLIVVDTLFYTHMLNDDKAMHMDLVMNYFKKLAKKYHCAILFLQRAAECGRKPAGSFVTYERHMCQSLWELAKVKSKKAHSTHRLTHTYPLKNKGESQVLFKQGASGDFSIIKQGVSI